MRFEAQVVIVTGGAKGIGSGCVRVFHEEGGLVSILDRDQATGQALADELNAVRADSALFVSCDVTDYAQLQGAITETVNQFGRLDCLINNAGTHPGAIPLENVSIEQMESLWRLNFMSTFAASQYAMPHLRQTQGTIINMSSMTAVLGQNQSSAYCATKGAQLSFTKALAIEAAEYGVRVNAVLPSNIDTPLMREWAKTQKDPATVVDHMASLQVFKRLGTPAEIGRICLFLATPDSSFLTGQGIEADGGAALDY